ncbi:hypothetical protein EMPS_10533 [Entomortierella parvispora]|uniref:Crinkler effector protein N-terminal domain-containing protein n=1 Tax=Entomortierella parvispora TaxID=205924 RepID=A0A9P3M198_9FUNG|nr:hypothetical protein EMPS_10533 [Entomortierella parvispora]
MATDTLTLFCIISGDPLSFAFPVKVQSSASVDELKKAIKETQKDAPHFTIPANELVLWQATVPTDKNTGGERIIELDSLDDKTKLDNPRTSLSKLIVDDSTYIIVERPKAHAGRPLGLKRDFDTAMLEGLEKIMTILHELKEEKKSVISLSRVTEREFRDIMNENGLAQRAISFAVDPTTLPAAIPGRHIEPFAWGPESEAAQADDCKEWLENNTRLPEGILFCITSRNANLLRTMSASTKYELNGTTDMVILPEEYLNTTLLVPGLQIGIELKKSDVGYQKHTFEATLQLLSASLSSNFCPVIVLTDLKEYWRFFWLEPRVIVTCEFGLQDGVALLEKIAHEPRPTPIVDTAFQSIPATDATPYRRRCQFTEAVRRTPVEDVVLPEGSSSAHQVRKLQRTVTDITDSLPGGDVADMRDFFDVMTEEEKSKWWTKCALEVMKNSPALQALIPDGY